MCKCVCVCACVRARARVCLPAPLSLSPPLSLTWTRCARDSGDMEPFSALAGAFAGGSSLLTSLVASSPKLVLRLREVSPLAAAMYELGAQAQNPGGEAHPLSCSAWLSFTPLLTTPWPPWILISNLAISWVAGGGGSSPSPIKGACVVCVCACAGAGGVCMRVDLSVSPGSNIRPPKGDSCECVLRRACTTVCAHACTCVLDPHESRIYLAYRHSVMSPLARYGSGCTRERLAAEGAILHGDECEVVGALMD